MKLNEALQSRLYNYKFGSALEHIEGEKQEVRDLVEALGNSFSDVGWFTSDLSVIIMNALENIGVEFQLRNTAN